VAANIHIPINHLASPSAAAALLASASNHFEAVGSRTITSQKASVAPAVPVIEIPVYFQSAEPAGSRPIEVFSAIGFAKVHVTPLTPLTPETPLTPQAHATPLTPLTPDIQLTPQAPAVHVVPETPETPDTPDTQQAPVVPVVPDTPETPLTPQAPKLPVLENTIPCTVALVGNIPEI